MCRSAVTVVFRSWRHVQSTLSIVTLVTFALFVLQYSIVARQQHTTVIDQRSAPNETDDAVSSVSECSADQVKGVRHQTTTKSAIGLDRSVEEDFNEPETCDSLTAEVSRILLVTYFRSGSSFVGDLLQQTCSTFYSFEPLHSMSEGVRIEDSRAEEAYFLLAKIFQCSFPEIVFYVRWALKLNNRFLFKWNRLLWSRCQSRPVTCFNPAFVKDVCKQSKVQVIKTTRLSVKQVLSWIHSLPESLTNSLKVVLLVRDPRGIFNSRKNLIWCANKTCADPQSLCSEMMDDLMHFRDLESQLPEQAIMLRYEELSLNPERAARRLFRRLQLPFTARVQRFLKTHTSIVPQILSQKHLNPYSTIRNSVSTAFEWVNKLTLSEMTAIQSVCKPVIEQLQLFNIHNSE